MPDREKVIKGLELCTHDISLSNNEHKDDYCKSCPYHDSNNSYCFNQQNLMKDALALLKEVPEIVRCKDCKHHGKDTCGAVAGIAYPPPDDWFCADGERK